MKLATHLRLLTSALLLLFSTHSLAYFPTAESFYFGGGFGWSVFPDAKQENFFGNPLVRKSTSGFKFFTGYYWTDNIATELMYIDFGKFRIPNFNADIDVYALGGGFSFNFPLSMAVPVSLGGNVGLFGLNYKFNGTITYAAPTTQPANGLAFGYGVFGELLLVQNAYLRVSWDQIINRVTGDALRLNQGLLSANLVINLGSGK
jgi:hypothetical protein